VGNATAMKQSDTLPNSDVNKYTKEINFLQQEFNSHFQDLHKYESTINLFSVPFDINVTILPTRFEMEMILDLQGNVDLRNILQHVRLLEFFKFPLTADKFPVLVTCLF
jgi:hypothetical protein